MRIGNIDKNIKNNKHMEMVVLINHQLMKNIKRLFISDIKISKMIYKTFFNISIKDTLLHFWRKYKLAQPFWITN